MLIALLAASLSISLADAAIPNAMLRGSPGIPRIPVPGGSLASPNGTALPPITTAYYFDQLIDHNNTELGTFQQRYWADWEFYEAGSFLSPVESGHLMDGYTFRRSYHNYDSRRNRRRWYVCPPRAPSLTW